DDMRDVIPAGQSVRVLLCGSSGPFRIVSGVGVVLQPRVTIPIPESLASGLIELPPRGAQFLVKDTHRLAGKALVLGQIEVAARGDALQFLGSEGELEENVHGGARVMREFLRL